MGVCDNCGCWRRMFQASAGKQGAATERQGRTEGEREREWERQRRERARRDDCFLISGQRLFRASCCPVGTQAGRQQQLPKFVQVGCWRYLHVQAMVRIAKILYRLFLISYTGYGLAVISLPLSLVFLFLTCGCAASSCSLCRFSLYGSCIDSFFPLAPCNIILSF